MSPLDTMTKSCDSLENNATDENKDHLAQPDTHHPHARLVKRTADSKNLFNAKENSLDEETDEVSNKHGKRIRQDLRGLYLDTINRARLDFDFEKLCSVSLSNLNVYACLVCGKYFQGRGVSSNAYYHSMGENHHVFINMDTLNVYVLPELYKVDDLSLNDIKYVIKPTFTEKDVEMLNKLSIHSYDLNNKMYIPGFVGLNNIKENDYINVIVQSFAHVELLRDYFLLDKSDSQSELVKRFGLLLRKMWNSRAFKGQVSPHELIQEISNVSDKRFKLGEQADPAQFLSWLINKLHLGLCSKKSNKSSIMQQAFQGELYVESRPFITDQETGESNINNLGDATVSTLPFWFLTLDLPPPPLFSDEAEKNIIPQIPLTTLLEKFNGTSVCETGSAVMTYKIQKLPRYLIFSFKRFSKNNWNAFEKNPTIVNFPIKNLDMADYVQGGESARYDLIANICHEGKPGTGNGAYKVHLLSKAKSQWLQIQDLFVEEIMAQMIILSETYIQIWERNSVSK
ncbi:hypothetical protein BDV3_003845 [Batrachochytrium dendrobatidis]|uniref:USP domain-containing protein n=1 Tax=Batrachochytrium dendrobatidis (strain JEL423) TaxID=403673 RepID=A0A177WDV9_BATDL|nr:Ubiquitin carboxyl-terminal hydrolase 10 [Batrachochytrium dendrobatidis]OAJ38297.1 hypothetical protein BDEG_22244 [Batrachochytrium dendrobatidis JEL423]